MDVMKGIQSLLLILIATIVLGILALPASYLYLLLKRKIRGETDEAERPAPTATERPARRRRAA